MLETVRLETVTTDPNIVDTVKLDTVVFNPNSVDIFNVEPSNVLAMILENTPFIPINVDPFIVEFTVKVLIVIAFPIIVEKEIMLVDTLVVLIVDPVILEFVMIVLAVMTFPTIVENAI